MRVTLIALLCVVAGCTADPAPPPSTAPPPQPLRALLITGGHEHDIGFYSIFDSCKNEVRITVSSSNIAYAKDFRDKYDVLILYDFTRDPDEATKKNLRDFVEAGKGIVVLHHALLDYQSWPWWYQEVVGGSYRLGPTGSIPASTYKAAQPMSITPQKHPITAGIEPFQLTDETYKRMWIAPDVKPLLTTDCPASDLVIAWISPYPKSKVVYIQLGHGHGSWDHPSFRAIVHNAILWSAGRLNLLEINSKALRWLLEEPTK
jgi:type 1 glutamine amidotransferase